VDLELSDDQVVLRDEFRRFLADRCTAEVRRAAAVLPGAVDRPLFAALAGMGTFVLTRSEQDGGVGLGMAEAVVAFEELGRAAVPGPLIATFLAAGLDGVDGVDGEVVGLAARVEPSLVEHLDGIDALLVVDAGGVAVAPAALVSGGRPVERPLDPLTPVSIVASLPAGLSVGGADTADRLRRDGALLAAAMQVGLGQAAVDLAVEYAKSRTQFGRAIGSFQALKHLLADAAVGVEVARAAVHAGAVAVDESGDAGGGDGGAAGVHAARVVASSAARRATASCIQVHGGMGYTWELDAHLYLKRVLVLDQHPATPDDALEAIAAGW